jgi:hypothetical protein
MADISRFGEPTEKEPKTKPKDISRFGAPSEELISSGSAALRGAKTALLEPVYGLGEYIPGEIGQKSAQAAKELEQEYQQAVKQRPVATRAGYVPTAVAEMFIPGTAGFKAAKGASTLTKAAMGGGAAGLTAGAVAPTGQEDYSKRMEEKAKSAGLGAALGTTIGVAGPLAVKGGKAVGEYARGFKTPSAIADVEGITKVGEKGFDLLKSKAKKLYEQRSTEANQKYSEAFDVARKAQAKGEPFAASPQGQNLIASLENEKSVVAGGQKFAVGEEQVKGIDRLISAIKGISTGGERVPIGAGKVSANVTKKTPVTTKEKDIKAIVEELRFLRDVDAKGKPYEAYASLDANYKRDLIKKLETALYDWNAEYKVADNAYKAASEKLRPFKTDLMSKALKGEKFHPEDLVASPEDFGRIFFKDVDGVRQLTAVTQDPAQVTKLSKEYVASLLAEKTPAEVKNFATNPQNIGWMKAANIYDDVVKYADQASVAASRQKILSRLGYGVAATSIGAAIGSPLLYQTRRMLGL